MSVIKYCFFAVLILAGCSEKKIEITPEYIINENWSKKNDHAGGNSIKINKMNLKKDSTIDLLLNPNNAAIISKLEEDRQFRWYANVKIKEENYKNQKIYFSKDNGFTWFNDIENKRNVNFGNLQKGNWYKFSNLVSYPYFIYIYIDSSNAVHRFDVNPANY